VDRQVSVTEGGDSSADLAHANGRKLVLPLKAFDSTMTARQTRPDLMTNLMRFPSAVRRDPDVDAWFAHDGLRQFALPWFEQMRGCGADVRELLHDGHPTACVDDAAFGYVNAFTAHVNVGFFQGAFLADPAGLLEGTGKRMRHVKLRWAEPVNTAALGELITAAYRDMRLRLRSSA
jgi:hypothetical protein